jgi:hypothetical protein
MVLVKVVDKGQHFGLQVGHGDESAAFEQLAHEHTERKLNLGHPGRVFGSVVKDIPVGWIGQKGRPSVHPGQAVSGIPHSQSYFDARLAARIAVLVPSRSKRSC